MKNFIVNDIVNELNEGKLELVDYDTTILLDKIDMYTTIADVKYRDRLRDMELRNSIESYNDDIKRIIDRLNNIEVAAIKNKNEKLMFICENRKATLINLMTYLQNKYL